MGRGVLDAEMRQVTGQSVAPDTYSRLDRHQEAAFVLRLHWGVIALTPLLVLLSGKDTLLPVWVILGFFVLLTACLQAFVGLKPERVRWTVIGYEVLISDLFLVTVLIWARGGLATDAYHFYYLIIVGAAILFGVRESILFALAAGLLYSLALWLPSREIPNTVWARLAIRTVYFVLMGVATAYLSAQEHHHRKARVETQRLLAELQEAHTQLKVHAREMSQRAITDGLTGLYNHTYFHQRLEEELGRSERYGRPLSLIMVDFDDFKVYNDAYGHLEGDRVLAKVARLLADSVRKIDIACRYGGDEFAVIMADTGAEAAVAAAERVREAVAGLGCSSPPIGADPITPLTVSVGVAAYPQHGRTRAELIKAADAALYLSKGRGKNVVTFFELPVSLSPDSPTHTDA